MITASMLYDLVYCPHRISMDAFADPKARDPVSPFVQLLWERGNSHEDEVVAALKVKYVDLSGVPRDEKVKRTSDAMDAKEPLIYAGRIERDDLVGEPDLLRLEACGYVPGDIKSGSAEEGPDELSRPKIHYAVQLALYIDILERQKRLTARRGYIWDIHGAEVPYDFSVLIGVKNPRTMWQDYEECLAQAKSILAKESATLPALASVCKLCHWRTHCYDALRATDDLTLITELGRSKRDVMASRIKTVKALAAIDLAGLVKAKKTPFAGVGPDSLAKFKARAILLSTPGSQPYSRQAIALPERDTEVFFDIETDPMRDICYLHGFIVRQRRDNATEKFVHFFADEPTAHAEEQAFREALDFLGTMRPCALYYYSHYEKTYYTALQEKYPGACKPEEIEQLFSDAGTVDLYTSIVRRHTEWPTNDQSIKTLAKFLGFQWRDTDPSGAASIEWYDRWVKTREPRTKTRILEYNEDDCKATRVLVDGLRTIRIQA